MPKLWTDTIEAHRRAVREATLDTTAALVAAHGLASVTMSRIAKEAGIGRATLYKYFADVDAILVAWHERHVHRHLEHLAAVRDGVAGAGAQLEAALTAYATMTHARPGTDLAAALHRSDHVERAHQRLQAFLRDLVAAGVRTGDVRDDVPVEELTSFVLHALTAASTLPSDAVPRVVALTLDGLRPRP
ncbi:MAG TPA: TetR/AcrR family transcriptional regulator [Mycobacteriales bacterium]